MCTEQSRPRLNFLSKPNLWLFFFAPRELCIDFQVCLLQIKARLKTQCKLYFQRKNSQKTQDPPRRLPGQERKIHRALFFRGGKKTCRRSIRNARHESERARERGRKDKGEANNFWENTFFSDVVPYVSRSHSFPEENEEKRGAMWPRGIVMGGHVRDKFWNGSLLHDLCIPRTRW